MSEQKETVKIHINFKILHIKIYDTFTKNINYNDNFLLMCFEILFKFRKVKKNPKIMTINVTIVEYFQNL